MFWGTELGRYEEKTVRFGSKDTWDLFKQTVWILGGYWYGVQLVIRGEDADEARILAWKGWGQKKFNSLTWNRCHYRRMVIMSAIMTMVMLMMMFHRHLLRNEWRKKCKVPDLVSWKNKNQDDLRYAGSSQQYSQCTRKLTARGQISKSVVQDLSPSFNSSTIITTWNRADDTMKGGKRTSQTSGGGNKMMPESSNGKRPISESNELILFKTWKESSMYIDSVRNIDGHRQWWFDGPVVCGGGIHSTLQPTLLTLFFRMMIWPNRVGNLAWETNSNSLVWPMHLVTSTSHLSGASNIAIRYKLGIQYNGGHFRGWQSQPEGSFTSFPYSTVQQTLDVRHPF